MTELFIGVTQGVTKLTISDVKLDLTIDFKTLILHLNDYHARRANTKEEMVPLPFLSLKFQISRGKVY